MTLSRVFGDLQPENENVTLHHMVIFYGLDVFLFDFWRIVPWCTMEIITIKAPPFWRICSRNCFQTSNNKSKVFVKIQAAGWIGQKIKHTRAKWRNTVQMIISQVDDKKNPKAPWSSLKAILLRCGVSLCDGHWFGWISESPWPFTKKNMIWGAFKHLFLGNL